MSPVDIRLMCPLWEQIIEPGLTSRDLLNLLMLSAITETKAKDRVVLHRSKFSEVDLREVIRHWKGN